MRLNFEQIFLEKEQQNWFVYDLVAKWVNQTVSSYASLLPILLEGCYWEGVEEQCYWEGVAHLEHAAFHPRVRAPRAPKAKRRFIAGFLTLCRHCTALHTAHNVELGASAIEAELWHAVQHNAVRGLQ